MIAEQANQVIVRPAAPKDLDALLRFTRLYYGPASSQAKPCRIEWLFQHNPHSLGVGAGLLVAVRENEIVGSHWKMRLPWNIGGERIIVPSPHDLALLEPYRQAAGSAVPPGLQLALGVLDRERQAALLGLSPASETIYGRFQCQRVPMVRMQKLLSPVRAAFGVAANKLGLQRTAVLHGSADDRLRTGRTMRLLAIPDANDLNSALELPYRGGCQPAWDLDTYRWRFFHPMGPKHCLLLLIDHGETVGRIVFSFGLRRGAVMARIVDGAVRELRFYPELLDATETAMRRLNVAVTTVATTCLAAVDHLACRGWKVQLGVESRFFIRPLRLLDFSDLWGGAYDYGFDAA